MGIESKKKKPADYPQLVFRVTQVDKETLLKEIEQATAMMNKGREEDEKVVRGNHVAVKALYLGLSELKKKLKKA